jgi:tripartite-type tricarboxylate transporter receptor subunit TctC
MAPAATPKEVVARTAQEVARIVRDPKVVEQLGRDGYDPLGNSPAQFAAMIAADIPLWAEAVELAGVKQK